MHEHWFRENADEIEDLLKQYEDLRDGKKSSFLEEESFELIIEYFNENNNFFKALEVVETALNYFPYSGLLFIKKADLLIATSRYNEALDALQQAEFFDADKIGGKIILRHWRTGDRFQPIGLKSPAKLQDLFVNAKIPAARRRTLVLATTAAGEIFWVESLRIGEHFKLTPATRRQLDWNWSKLAV